MAKKTNWKKIKAEYISGGTSYRKLAEKHGVSRTTLERKAKDEGWPALRRQKDDKTTAKIVDSLIDSGAEKAVERLRRVSALTDLLLEKLEKAIGELDVQLCKDVVKEKVIEYNNDLRPDKPTKETIHEEEKIIEVKTVIDRSGLKAIASSLRDIKEIQMLKSELDRQEQEARIQKLRKEAERDDDSASEIEVVFKAGEDIWNE